MLVYVCHVDLEQKTALVCNPAYKELVDNKKGQMLVAWKTKKPPKVGFTYQCQLSYFWIRHNLIHGRIINKQPLEERENYKI